MKIDCRWFDSNLEAYCSETLPESDRRMAQGHLDACPSCSRQVQGLSDLDPLLKQVFQHRLARSAAHARQGQHLRSWRIAAVAAVVAVLLLFAGISILQRETPEQIATTPSLAPQAVDAPDKKDPDAGGIERAAPDVIPQPPIQPAPEAGTPITDGPEFAVIDAAGYSTTLENYRGYVLVFGIWSASQPETLQNLNRIYETFGSDPQVRFLGVASRRQEKAATIFPVVYNHGSQLLGLETGEFAVLDKTGKERLSGSLRTNADTLIQQIQGELNQIGVK